MVTKHSLIILLLLLAYNVCLGQKEEGYVNNKLTKRIKKLVCEQKHEEAYEVVLQNKESLGYFFVEKFSNAYKSSQWIDTVSVDSSQLFNEKRDKLHLIGMFLSNEYTTETINGVMERILIKKGKPAIHSFNHFGNFIKLSDKSIRKIKRKLKRKGWYKGKIDNSWNEHDRRQLVYFSHLETDYHGYPISLHDKYKVYERILFYILPPKPLPDKIAKRVGYKNARNVDKIDIRRFKNPSHKQSITEVKDIRRLTRLLARLKKVKRPEQKGRNAVGDYWRITIHYQAKQRQRYGELYIMKFPNKYIVVSSQAYYLCSEELIKIIDQF